MRKTKEKKKKREMCCISELPTIESKFQIVSFSTPGNYTFSTPCGVDGFVVRMKGAGGGGSGNIFDTSGGAGGAGGASLSFSVDLNQKNCKVQAFKQKFAITVGQGGMGTSTTSGGDGGNTTFQSIKNSGGVLAIAGGGQGGQYSGGPSMGGQPSLSGKWVFPSKSTLIAGQQGAGGTSLAGVYDGGVGGAASEGGGIGFPNWSNGNGQSAQNQDRGEEVLQLEIRDQV